MSADIGSAPSDWSHALAWLNEQAEDGHTITQVVVPFDGAPELYQTVWFGAPVIRGEEFYARTTEGGTLRP